MPLDRKLPPRARLVLGAFLLGLVGLAAPRIARENFFSAGGALEEARLLPEFTDAILNRAVSDTRWIGTEPLTTEAMRGQVWVLKVWAFGCINCVRSIPYANELSERFGGDLRVLGIHAPEYDWERDPKGLEAAIAKYGVEYPNYVDDGLDYFFALDAPAWPAFYVVDRAGRIRGCWVGEMHAGTFRARALEALVTELLARPTGPS